MYDAIGQGESNFFYELRILVGGGKEVGRNYPKAALAFYQCIWFPALLLCNPASAGLKLFLICDVLTFLILTHL